MEHKDTDVPNQVLMNYLIITNYLTNSLVTHLFYRVIHTCVRVGAQLPPDVTSFRKGGRLNDLGGHPGVGTRCAHLGGFVPLSRQAEVGDLERQVFHAVILNGFSQED